MNAELQQLAQHAGMCGPELDRILEAAYQVAKRVRSETALGEEHSGRGDPGLRIDAALTHEFGGPWGTRMTLGASISNLSLGDQVLRESVRELTPDGTGLTGRMTSKPVFWIPPFPSIIVRVKW